MIARSTVACLAALLAACHRPPQASAPQGPGSTHFGKVDSRPSAGKWFTDDARRARDAGAGESVVLVVDAASAGDRVTAVLALPADSCALLLARGSDGVEDLDLFAFADDGAALAADEGPDRAPSIMVCPPHPARIFVAARVASGEGMVAIGAQRVAPSEAARVGERVGAHGRPGESEGRAASWPGLEEALAARRKALGGAWADVRRTALPLDARRPTQLGAVIEAPRCLDVLVVPSDEAGQLDVAAVDSAGRIFARAANAGRERNLLLCAPAREAITIEVRPHQGTGMAAVVLSNSEPGAAGQLGARAVHFAPAALTDVATLRKSHDAALQRDGYAAPSLLGEGEAAVGQRTSLDVELPAGCARIDVLIGRPARGSEAWLFADDGRLLAKASGGAVTTLFACGARQKARLDLGASLLPGRFAAELYVERGAAKALTEQPLAASRLLGRLHDRGQLAGVGDADGPQVVTLDSARVTRLPISVPAGRCADVSVAIGEGGQGVDLRLRTSDGAEVARGHASVVASARACAPKDVAILEISAELTLATGRATALVASRTLAP